MALTIAIEGTGVLSNAESTTGWGVSGSGGVSIALNSEIYLQGSYSIGAKIGGKNGWIYYDVGSGNELDFGTSGNEEGEYVYIWFNCTTVGGLANKSTTDGGLMVRLGTDLTNYREWALGGADDLGNGYTGGWQCAIVDPSSAGSSDNLTYNVSSVRYFGFRFKVDGGSVAPNCFVDTIAVGKGLRITGTETTALEGWQEVADYCEDYANRAWGMVQTKGDTKFIYGNLYIGDSSQTAVTDFTGSNELIVFGDYEYWNSTGTAWISAISNGFHGITVEDASSYATSFEDGVIVGTETGRSGSTFLGATGADTTFDLYGGNNTGSVTLMYGSSFQGIDGGFNAGNDSDHKFLSCTFQGCARFDPVGAPLIRYCDFIDCLSSTDAIKWNSSINIEDCNFIANADTNSAGIGIDTAGTYTFTDLNFSGNGWDIFSTALATSVDYYHPTEDGDVDLYSGSITRVSQQFTGSAGTLSSGWFSIRKQGSPTGNYQAKVYANSGGAPTGTALAESIEYDIADLTTSFVLERIEFHDEYTLSAATEYHLSIEYSGGDSSNRLEVEYLTAGSGSETCNTYISSWSSQNYDCTFYVNRDGIVKINATRSNPTTWEIGALWSGCVIITNSVNLTITVKDEGGTVIQNAQTSIYTDDANRTELMNEDTNASGIAQESYNYAGDQDIEVRVRKASGGTNYKNFSTLGKITDDGYSLQVTLVEDPANSTT